MDQFLFGSGIFIILLTVVIHYMMEESKMTQEAKQIASVKEVIRTVSV